jgi:hypothetical protein
MKLEKGPMLKALKKIIAVLPLVISMITLDRRAELHHINIHS